MVCEDGANHPYLACLAFQACRDGTTVDVNLRAVQERARAKERERCAAMLRSAAKVAFRTEFSAAYWLKDVARTIEKQPRITLQKETP
jgi:hypothetical protein